MIDLDEIIAANDDELVNFKKKLDEEEIIRIKRKNMSNENLDPDENILWAKEHNRYIQMIECELQSKKSEVELLRGLIANYEKIINAQKIFIEDLKAVVKNA